MQRQILIWLLSKPVNFAGSVFLGDLHFAFSFLTFQVHVWVLAMVLEHFRITSVITRSRVGCWMISAGGIVAAAAAFAAAAAAATACTLI